jgi:sec-independent protein translocase protein TatB
MFDISWSELLILGVVTLIFVGPKELPRFMSALGRYAGIVRRHAQEFRQQFDQAMREAELADLRKEVESVRDEVTGTLREAERGAVAAIEVANSEREMVARAAGALDAPAPEEKAPPAKTGTSP